MKLSGERLRNNKEHGVVLLALLFFVAAMIVATAVALPQLLTQARREKEEEMIWRGEQYVRAIRLYYLKTQKLPTAVEDLTGTRTGVRFLRKPFADPMNGTDGSWRFIYLGPMGQLIGSTKPRILSPLAGFAGVGNPPPAVLPGVDPAGPAANNFASGAAAQKDSPDHDGDQDMQAAGLVNDSPVFGGKIIGIGSKMNKRSFRLYKGAKNYRQFEFIWDPGDSANLLLRPPILAPNETNGPPQGGAPNPAPQGSPPGG